MTSVDRRNLPVSLAISLATLGVAAIGAYVFSDMSQREPILSGTGVTAEASLSAYGPYLAGSPGDTAVYEIGGGEEGGTFLLLGGTHPQEISGLLAAVLVIENAVAERGRVFVVPQANQSGFSYTDVMEGYPHTFTIDTPNGPRWFRNGMRLTNPAHQWPDPDVYVHANSGEAMVGLEARNLNRNHPGSATGPLTAQVSHALTTLIETEAVDVVLDMHEAQPEYPVINMLVAHEHAFETAVYAVGLMADEGVEIDLMASPRNLHGLSHREFGDHTDAQAMLTETANPAMGRFRGRTDEALVVEGQDVNYMAAAAMGRLFVPFDEEGWPLTVRVARQLASIHNILEAYNQLNPENAIVLSGIPTYQDVTENGIGAYLGAPPLE